MSTQHNMTLKKVNEKSKAGDYWCAYQVHPRVQLCDALQRRRRYVHDGHGFESQCVPERKEHSVTAAHVQQRTPLFCTRTYRHTDTRTHDREQVQHTHQATNTLCHDQHTARTHILNTRTPQWQQHTHHALEVRLFHFVVLSVLCVCQRDVTDRTQRIHAIVTPPPVAHTRTQTDTHTYRQTSKYRMQPDK